MILRLSLNIVTKNFILLLQNNIFSFVFIMAGMAMVTKVI